MIRTNNRLYNEIRPITITPNYTMHTDGSVLIECGQTKVICTATITEDMPLYVKDQGWVSAEYSMLPSATHTRNKRGTNARSQEISRLIGRSLRACIDLKLLGRRQILIDCDVIQADGGTRTTSITGSFVALQIAINKLLKKNILQINPIKQNIAAISVGIFKQKAIIDLDYIEDSSCETDMNVVMLEDSSIVEIQATAEKNTLSRREINLLLDLAQDGIKKIIKLQKGV